MFKLLKMMFTAEPNWMQAVTDYGLSAQATLVEDPRAITKGIGGYEGEDGWIDLKVVVHPPSEPMYDARMKLKLSQAIFGLLAMGQTVNVKVDPKDLSHVLLSDDVHALIQSRVKN